MPGSCSKSRPTFHITAAAFELHEQDFATLLDVARQAGQRITCSDDGEYGFDKHFGQDIEQINPELWQAVSALSDDNIVIAWASGQEITLKFYQNTELRLVRLTDGEEPPKSQHHEHITGPWYFFAWHDVIILNI